jgi:hypothetical protein
MQRTLSLRTVAPFGIGFFRREPVCEDCSRSYKSVWRITRYSRDELCSHKMIRSIILGFRSGCSGCLRQAHSKLGSAGRNAKEVERGQLTLKCCPGCADELLSFEFQRYDGHRWERVEQSSFVEVLRLT